MEEIRRLEAVIARSVQHTADAIRQQGAGLQSPFREREMQRILAPALQMVLAAASSPITARQNFKVRFDSWPRVGPVDVALIENVSTSLIEGGEVHAAFLELKWGQGTLYNCVWDLAKMATAVSDPQGGARCGYLIAGAPEADWQKADGAELFSSGTTRLVDLYARYPAHWRKWCKEVKTHPRLLPQLVSRTLVAAVPVAVRSASWEIRCLRVSRAAGSGGWWWVAPIEEQFGVCGICTADKAQGAQDPPVVQAESPYPSDRDVEIADDHRRFDEGEVEALWRLVRNPPRWWRFIWFPGDVEIVGNSLEESWGNDAARLLRLAGSVETKTDLEKLRTAIGAFVAAHPGDATAISAGQSYVEAERHLELSG